jgi:hypothetical protein
MNAQNNKNLLVKLILPFIFILFLSIHSFGETKKQELIGLIRSLNSDYNFLWEKHTLSEQELRSFTIEKNKLVHRHELIVG